MWPAYPSGYPAFCSPWYHTAPLMVIPSSGWIIAFQLYLYTFLGHTYPQKFLQYLLLHYDIVNINTILKYLHFYRFQSVALLIVIEAVVEAGVRDAAAGEGLGG